MRYLLLLLLALPCLGADWEDWPIVSGMGLFNNCNPIFVEFIAFEGKYLPSNETYEMVKSTINRRLKLAKLYQGELDKNSKFDFFKNIIINGNKSTGYLTIAIGKTRSLLFFNKFLADTYSNMRGWVHTFESKWDHEQNNHYLTEVSINIFIERYLAANEPACN